MKTQITHNEQTIDAEISDEVGVRLFPPAESKTFPNYGEKYEYINSDGEITWLIWNNFSMDRRRKAIGNVFRPGEAQKALDKLKAWARINDYIDANGLRFDESTGLDWGNNEQQKWFWRYGYDEKQLVKVWSAIIQYSDNPVFRTMDDLQQVIAACNDDILVTQGVK